MSVRIKSLRRREETTLRLGGHGDNFHMSWAADDRQVVSLCDGFGWLEKPGGLYNSRLFVINGGPLDASFGDMQAYPELILWPGEDIVPLYYNFGTLALDRQIYQFLSTCSRRSDPSGFHFNGAKLIYSPGNGQTWRNQDGSSPVVWEGWGHRSRETMVFFEEPGDAFSLLTVLQMGRNYEANADGYVYVYAPNGNTEGTMNQLVMFRVPKDRILDRTAYEYFAGRVQSSATWAKDIDDRAVVHTFPSGWVNTTDHPYAWHPSVAYNAPLGLYMMANWGMGCAPDGMWFGKPSYLGFWTALDPCGPWTQVHEETAWTPDNDQAARAYQPQIAPRWITADGKAFWLVWTDYQMRGDPAQVQRISELLAQATSERDLLRLRPQLRQIQPYYAFNTQRVDLEID